LEGEEVGVGDALPLRLRVLGQVVEEHGQQGEQEEAAEDEGIHVSQMFC